MNGSWFCFHGGRPLKAAPAVVPLTLVFAISLIVSALVLFPERAAGAWVEGSARILTLSEIIPALSAAEGRPVVAQVAGDTPILVAGDDELDTPQALRGALILNGLRISEDAAQATVRPAQPRSERARALARRIPASPVPPALGSADAIARGGVVLFGALIAPPYKIELVADKVEVNGVAVFPPPGELTPPPTPSARVIEIDRRMAEARAAYSTNRARLGSEPARAQLLRELLAIPSFIQAEWISEVEVRIVRDNGIEEHMSFDELRPPDPDAAIQFLSYLEEQAATFRQILADDATLLCGATYLIPVTEPDSQALRARIAAIRASADSEPLKLARLQAYAGNRDAAADLLYAQ